MGCQNNNGTTDSMTTYEQDDVGEMNDRMGQYWDTSMGQSNNGTTWNGTT